MTGIRRYPKWIFQCSTWVNIRRKSGSVLIENQQEGVKYAETKSLNFLSAAEIEKRSSPIVMVVNLIHQKINDSIVIKPLSELRFIVTSLFNRAFSTSCL